MSHHLYHIVELKDVDGVQMPYLNGTLLIPNQHIEIILPDLHKLCGKVFYNLSCVKNEQKPFISFCYHGIEPWIYLVGLKAKRL